MQIPLTELANYPRFHEAAGAAIEVVCSIPGTCAAIFHQSDQGWLAISTNCKNSGLFDEGKPVPHDSPLAKWLMALGSEPSTVFESSANGAGTSYTRLAGTPIQLSDGRVFGRLCAFGESHDEITYDQVPLLGAVSRMLGFALDAEVSASHDRLTGLYSRSTFDDHLAIEIARARRGGVCLAVMAARFIVPTDSPEKSVTWWLPRVAERLTTSVREGDTIARLGAREFALILPDLRDGEAARRVAGALVDSMSDAFDVDGTPVSLRPHVGVALLPYDGFDVTILLERAIAAMEQTQLDDQPGYRLFSERKGFKLVLN